MFETFPEPSNEFYFNRYKKFITNYIENPVDCQENYFEKHHILPISFGGTNNDENIINLTPRMHYIVHWMLAKAFGGKMWAAFSMMMGNHKNVHRNFKINSRFYEEARINMKSYCSKINTGKRLSKETKNKISKKSLNKTYVFDSETKKEYRIEKTELNSWLENGYLFGRSQHYKESLNKNHPIKGKICVNNEIEVKYVTPEEFESLSEKWKKGQKPSFKQTMSNKTKNKSFYHNPKTGDQKRFIPGEQPDNWKKGRINFNNQINKKENRKGINIFTKEKEKLYNDESELNDWIVFHNQKLIFYFIDLDGTKYVSVNKKTFPKFLANKLNMKIGEEIMNPNNDFSKVKSINSPFKGYCINDFSIHKIPLEDANKFIDPEKDIWIP